MKPVMMTEWLYASVDWFIKEFVVFTDNMIKALRMLAVFKRFDERRSFHFRG
jgi:hypothetical protein